MRRGVGGRDDGALPSFTSCSLRERLGSRQLVGMAGLELL